MSLDRHSLAAATLALLATSAHAGRPLVTEDAGVLGKGECEWESYAGSARASGSSNVSHWNTQLACHVIGDTQAAVSYGQVSGGGTKAQIASINGKTGLYKSKEGDLGITLAWGVLGSKFTGGSFGTDGIFLNGVLTKQINENLTVNANLGWARDHTVSPRRGYSSANFALEYNLGNGLEVMGEVMSIDGESGYGLGLRYAASKAWSLSIGYLAQNPSPQVKLWTVGATLTF